MEIASDNRDMSKIINNHTKAESVIPDFVRVRKLCIKHAGDLINSAAQLLEGRGFPNISFHLAILALEEIGKAGMLLSRAATGKQRGTSWIDARLDDHIWKLQWALWAPAMRQGSLNPKDFIETRKFAERVHSRRLAGLYVNHSQSNDNILSPRAAVSKTYASSFVNLAQARLELEKSFKPKKDPDTADLEWFLQASTDDREKHHIFSKQSISKHAELAGNTAAWVNWLRKESEARQASELEHARKELARQPLPEEARRPKWRITIRLFSRSMTIRPKTLNYWNNRIPDVQLKFSKQKELLVELSIDNRTTASDIWDRGFSFSQVITACLNIGSMDFLWYDKSRHVDTFYEIIEDLDAQDMKLQIRKGPNLDQIFQQRSIQEVDLQRAIECLISFAGLHDGEAEPIFGPYLSGLLYLSKSDVLLNTEVQARDAFGNSLREACRKYDDWDGNEQTLEITIGRTLNSRIGDTEVRKELFQVISKDWSSSEGRLVDAARTKLLTDIYLSEIARRIWLEKISKFEGPKR